MRDSERCGRYPVGQQACHGMQKCCFEILALKNFQKLIQGSALVLMLATAPQRSP
jgi:hypothetical protein